MSTQVSPHELVTGKFYEVKFRMGGTYLCEAISHNRVKTKFKDGKSYETTGGIDSCISCIEIPKAYFITGKQMAIENNSNAKFLLEQEW